MKILGLVVSRHLLIDSKSNVTQSLPAPLCASSDALHREPLLHKAIPTGHIEIVRILLENGASVDTIDNSGSSALSLAVRGRNLKMAEMLLSYHADPNRADATGATPLEMAVELADDSLVRLLVQNGAKIT